MTIFRARPTTIFLSLFCLFFLFQLAFYLFFSTFTLVRQGANVKGGNVFIEENTHLIENVNNHELLDGDNLSSVFLSCHEMTKQQQKWRMRHQQPRDFNKFPIKIGGGDMKKVEEVDCAVPCFHYPYLPVSFFNNPSIGDNWNTNNAASPLFDASFTDHYFPNPDQRYTLDSRLGFSVLRSMESASNFPQNEISIARGHVDIVMTTSLDSDVPVPYFSWVLHDYMKPPRPKTKKALSSVFISNCHAKNYRLQVAKSLHNIDHQLVDLFGKCFDNTYPYSSNTTKEDTIGTYKFHLAFENSNDADYVSEKFFQALVEGTVPVVIGAPNIEDFTPSANSVLKIKSLSDVRRIAAKMRRLGRNEALYEKMLHWKEVGPSNKFKALIDLAIVHSSCRLCIYVADRTRQKERIGEPPCSCSINNTPTSRIYHFYVRERGHFDYIDAYMTAKGAANYSQFINAVVKAFKKSSPHGYWPMWTRERDELGRRPLLSAFYQRDPPNLEIYRVYEVNQENTPRKVLYGNGAIDSGAKVQKVFKSPKCVYLEVIFV